MMKESKATPEFTKEPPMQTLAAATATPAVAHDPVMERELFLANWDLMELSVTIPQSDAPTAIQNVY